MLAGAGLELRSTGEKPLFGGTGRVVVVVDRSMSMSLADSGSTLLERAKSEATRVISSLPDGTRVALVTYADKAERLTPELPLQTAGGDEQRLVGLDPELGAGGRDSGAG